METNPSVVAREFRLREWAEMIRECRSRPENVTVREWCNDHHITKTNYYYRLQQVRKACLDCSPEATPARDIAAVPSGLLDTGHEYVASSLELTANGIHVHVTDATSPELLKMVLGVIANAE